MYDKKFNFTGFITWIISVIFFLYEFLLRTILGTYQNPIKLDLNLTSFEFTTLSTTIFLIIYAFMQIPVGIIVNNIGLKKSLLIGSFLCFISCIGFSISNYFFATIFRMLMGFGASFGFISLLISVYQWINPKYRAVFIGLSQLIGTLGPIIAAGPLNFISTNTEITWRIIFLSLGIIGVAIFILILFFVKSIPQKNNQYIILHKPQKIINVVKKLFFKTQPWLIALTSACLYFSIEYLSENEGKFYLENKGFSSNNASYIISITWIGYALGCPIIGLLSDTLERRKLTISLCGFLAILSTVFIVYSQKNDYFFYAFFILGISASGQSICFSLIAEQFKKELVAIGFGLNNTVITLFSAINASLIALVIDYKNNTNINYLENLSFAFHSLIIIVIIGFFISVLFIKETFCKSQQDFTYLKINSNIND